MTDTEITDERLDVMAEVASTGGLVTFEQRALVAALRSERTQNAALREGQPTRDDVRFCEWGCHEVIYDLEAVLERERTQNRELLATLSALVVTSDEASDFTSAAAVVAFNNAHEAARAVLSTQEAKAPSYDGCYKCGKLVSEGTGERQGRAGAVHFACMESDRLSTQEESK